MYLPPFHKLLDIARAYVAEASTVLQLTFLLSLESTTQHICVHNTEENGLSPPHYDNSISTSSASQYTRVYTVIKLVSSSGTLNLFLCALKRSGCMGTRLHCNTDVLFS